MALLAVVFFFGFEAVLAQVLLLREFLVSSGGNELVLALFYGGWFLGIFAGALTAAVRHPREDRVWRIAPLLLCLQAVWLPAAIALVRVWRGIADIPQGTLMPFGTTALAVLCAVGPFGFLTGYLFPLLCRIRSILKIGGDGIGAGGGDYDLSSAKGGEAQTIGLVYGFEALGSLVGGLATAFVLIELVRPLPAAAGAAAATAFLAAWLVRKCAPGVGSRTGQGKSSRSSYGMIFAFTGLLGCVLAVAPFVPLFHQLEAWTIERQWWTLAGEMQHVAERETPYQRIDLGVLDEQYSLLFDGQFAGAFPDPYSASTSAHLCRTEAPGARRILLIGGGFTGIVAELLRYPDTTVDSVELDPGVLRVVEGRLPPETRAALKNGRVTIHWIDGRRYVKEAAGAIARGERPPFDLVISLAPNPTNGVNNRFFTADFFREVRAALAPDGVFVLRMGSAVNYFGPEVRKFTGSVYATARSVYPAVLATPGDTTWIFASSARDRLTSDPAVLARRYESSGIESPSFRPEYFQMAFQPGPTALTNETFQSERMRVPINTDARPITYLYGLRLWGRFSGSAVDAFFRFVERLGPLSIGLAVIFLLVCRIVYIRIFHKRSAGASGRNALFTMSVTGGVGMALSLVLLFEFQNVYGHLYREVGLLVGLFMAGLAAGGFAFRRPGRPAGPDSSGGRDQGRGLNTGSALTDAMRRLRSWQAVFGGFIGLAAVCLVAVAAPWTQGLLSFAASGAAIGLLMLGAGFMTGAEFPMVGHVMAAGGVGLPRRAGWLESLDHLGAMAGAMATGLVLVPCLGIPGTLLLLAGVKFACVLLLPPPRAALRAPAQSR